MVNYSGMADSIKDISIVIPLFNEVESLPELHQWILRVMIANNFSYEVVFVDDGSKDGSWKVIESIADQDSNVRGIKFQRNYGKSAALQVGFEAAIYFEDIYYGHVTHFESIRRMRQKIQEQNEDLRGLRYRD